MPAADTLYFRGAFYRPDAMVIEGSFGSTEGTGSTGSEKNETSSRLRFQTASLHSHRIVALLIGLR
jgi:hypothetical protein